MKRIVFKIFLGALPILLLIAIYIINDPFKVLYKYSSYYPTDGIQYVSLNNDYTSVETYMHNQKNYHYDSYIFGNSRGMLFHIGEWQKHIVHRDCFQFSVSNESLFGIERKISLIDSLGGDVRNVLIIMDEPLYKVAAENSKFPKHPLLSGTSKIGFQINNFKGFFEKEFLLPYLKLLISKRADDRLFAGSINNKRSVYDVKTNDLQFPDIDPAIDADTAAYYLKRKNIFNDRPLQQQYSENIAMEVEHMKLLKHIKNILNKHNSEYKIIISPLYNQVKPNQKDFERLVSVFGNDHIYDYSGINSITADKTNYYENAHFRVFIANRIMDSVYKK